MKLTVYRQASKKRDDGMIVYKGEDTLPYTGDSIFFVADGLGGASAIRHQNIAPDLFDKEKIMDTLFKGVYEEYSDEKFVKYVTDSFFELFAVKDCYTANVYNIKKSGYFGSRIASAIVLHEMIYNESLNPDKLFDHYNSLEAEEKKEAFLNSLGERFANKIYEDMKKIASNANLIYESPYSGLALLGTTICATIYREKDEYVEALYLTAGDSRPYLWTESEGLCQLLEDEEGKDGGMTNYIKANEDATFHIRCDYMKFKKPCVLFNASDGCFDSSYFISPLAFEKLILEKAKDLNDTEELSKALHEKFLTIGTHDDSSTIAMIIYGYDSFESFKKSAELRLKIINDDYISKMPDLLEMDYVQACEEKNASFKTLLAGIKAKFEKEEAVMQFCVEHMKNVKYSPYENKIMEIEKQVSELQEQKKQALKDIENIVACNFVRFLDPIVHKDNFVPKFIQERMDPIYKIQNIELKYQKQVEYHKKTLENYQTNFENTTNALKSEINRIVEIGVPSDASSYNGIDISSVKKYNQFLNSLNKYLIELKSGNNNIFKKLSNLRKEYKDNNKKLALENQDKLHEITNNIVSSDGLPGVHGSFLFEDDNDHLLKCRDDYNEADRKISLLQNEERKNIEKEFGVQYWDNNYKEIIEPVIADTTIDISQELRDEAKAVILDLNEKAKEYIAKAEMQTKLFKQYDITYNKYLGGTK